MAARRNGPKPGPLDCGSPAWQLLTRPRTWAREGRSWLWNSGSPKGLCRLYARQRALRQLWRCAIAPGCEQRLAGLHSGRWVEPELQVLTGWREPGFRLGRHAGDLSAREFRDNECRPDRFRRPP